MINLSFSDAPSEHIAGGANFRFKILGIPSEGCIIDSTQFDI